MSNGEKSDFDDSFMFGSYTDQRFPVGCQIHKLELIYSLENSELYWLKFFDRNGEVILDCG
jgi:hypothetical protein